MSAHTPGPCQHNEMVPNADPNYAWKCAACGYIYGKGRAHTPGPSLTSKCPDCGHVYLSHFAVNHKCPLHAAAPEMLEALSGVLKWLDHIRVEGNGADTAIRIGAKSCAVKARAAIAKAKGESK